MEVSVWLNESAVMVSTLVGHARVWEGADDGRLMSYMLIAEDDTAKEGSVRCLVMLVKALFPRYVAAGALFGGVMYGS